MLLCFLRTGYFPDRIERVCPDVPDWYFEQHFKVYRFFQQLAVGKHVLDIGCGTGYGTAHLGDVADAVGIDIDEPTIIYARKKYPDVRFEIGDVHDLSRFPDGSFDRVISTENFEHLRDVRGHLREVRRVLSPSGICFIATPNPEMTYHLSSNPHHVREYEYKELADLIASEFSEFFILENKWEPSSQRGKDEKAARISRGDYGIAELTHVFGCQVNSDFVDNTHSFWVFAR